jgi:pyruvoyl-dependent arginine decarboxylase (PvlArgDC)
MTPILKFMGGILLGTALGAGIYVVFTQDNENGIIAGAKTFANNIVEEGQRAAEMRRTELKIELGQIPSTGNTASETEQSQIPNMQAD